MIGGAGMPLACGRNRSRRRMTEYQEAGCSREWMQPMETLYDTIRLSGTCAPKK